MHLMQAFTNRRNAALAACTVALVIAVAPVWAQQAAGESSRTVAGGGVFAPGWTGKVDANEEKAGQTLKSAKFSLEKGAIKVTTGPAVAYWNPANK
ncbi:MAG TPA: hypothetical protein VNH18_12550, partial [Bryobacteraceae bacterium]|nr:hypothetical protein [Bryobacteraceae bacterium]